jgi:DNA-binding GntR family transcriptional regulator
MIHQPPTKAELALQVLRERILNGELPVGHRLRVQDLTAEFQMSSTPIREALRLLQADRLVAYRPHQGVVVAPLRSDSVEEIYRLRIVLEPLAVSLAVRKINEERLAEIEAAHQQILEAASLSRATKLADLNRHWHWALYESADSPLCVDFIGQLWDAFAWRTIWSVPGRAETAAQEHESVMEALRARDSTGAAEAMRRHIEGSQALMVAGVSPTRADHEVNAPRGAWT